MWVWRDFTAGSMLFGWPNLLLLSPTFLFPSSQRMVVQGWGRHADSVHTLPKLCSADSFFKVITIII